MGLVISLCDYTGNMVKPWVEGGHTCVIVDTKHEKGKAHPVKHASGGSLNRLGYRVEEIRDSFTPAMLASAIVFSFPPCTDVAVSGAAHFKSKGLEALIGSLSTLTACVRIIEQSKAGFVENPVSTFSSYWRKPDAIIHPYEYASASDNFAEEMYPKKTCLWTHGQFILPPPRDIFVNNPHKIHYLGSAGQEERSITPLGFAYAVYDANKHLLDA